MISKSLLCELSRKIDEKSGKVYSDRFLVLQNFPDGIWNKRHHFWTFQIRSLTLEKKTEQQILIQKKMGALFRWGSGPKSREKVKMRVLDFLLSTVPGEVPRNVPGTFRDQKLTKMKT